MLQSPRTILVDLVKKYNTITQNPRRCRAFLLDLCGQSTTEIFVLISAIEEGIVATLKELNHGIMSPHFIEQLAQRLCNQRAIKYPLALWGVESWSIALGLISPQQCMTSEFVDIKSETIFISQSEVQLRKALFEAFEDGIITEKEKEELQELSQQLNVPLKIANQIFIEVKTDKQNSGSTLPDTLIVCKDGQGHFQTIQQALVRAKPYSKILIKPGEYRETLQLNKPLELIGQGTSEQVIIKQNRDLSIKLNTITATFRGITFYCQEGLKDKYPICFLTSGQLTLENCRLIAGDQAQAPCLIAGHSKAILILKDCYIRGQSGGIILAEGSQGNITNSLIQGGNGIGILIQNKAQLNLSHSTISTSSIGIYCSGKGLMKENNIFSKNTGVLLEHDSQAILYQCQIKGNKIGVLTKKGAMGKVEKCTLTNNSEIAIDINPHSHTSFLWNKVHDNYLGMRLDQHIKGMILDNQFSKNKKHWHKPPFSQCQFKRNEVI